MSFIHHPKSGLYTYLSTHQTTLLQAVVHQWNLTHSRKRILFQSNMSEAETKTEVFTITDMREPASEKDNTNKKTCIFEQYVQPCLVELLGTTLFVFVGCSSVIGNVGTTSAIQPAVAHGLALAVLIMMFGQIR